jgi:hypothetical protein
MELRRSKIHRCKMALATQGKVLEGHSGPHPQEPNLAPLAS